MTINLSQRRVILGAGVLLVLMTLALSILSPGRTSAHGGAHDVNTAQETSPVTVELMKPVSFKDDVDARFRVKLNSGGTRVINVDDMDYVLNATITIEPGGALPWHTHPGPAVATIQEGSLTVTNASDCRPRMYEEGEGFLDPGRGNVHMARNYGDVPTVVHVTYFEVPIIDGQPRPTIPAEDPNCGFSSTRILEF